MDREVELDDAAIYIQDAAAAYLQAKKRRQFNEIQRLRKEIHDILFEERECIPDGVYLKLMNAIKVDNHHANS